MNKVHEFLARLCLIERTREGGGGCYGVLLLYSAHLHAHVLGLDDDHNAHRVEGVLDAVLYLLGQSFLHLQTV